MSFVPNQRPESSAPRPTPAPIPVPQLLIWGAAHGDKAIRAHAEKLEASLEALRKRYAADSELARIDGEAARLEKQLEDLRARKEELAPGKPARKPRSYNAATVRAWAVANGITVPERGQVPKKVVEAWKAANEGGAES
ncbi:histone-like nucleoid-structuring protein Lsr2 [Streptomyces sp. NPDC102487]|uniref:Lsr2 family DNA-binding protein n=1 Tax=Streptomyces sp. NPDC102487 TaxID=3366182 RepID=UPI0037F84DB5